MEFLRVQKLKSSLEACCFLLRAVPKFLWRDVMFLKGEQKHKVSDTYFISNDYANVTSLWRLHPIWNEQAENTKIAEKQNTSFPEESVENTDLH